LIRVNELHGSYLVDQDCAAKGGIGLINRTSLAGLNNEFFEQLSGGGRVNVVGAVIPGDVAGAQAMTVFVDAPLALVTDGLVIDIHTSPGVRAWLSACWSKPLGPHAMADSLRYRLQCCHDDHTTLLIWPAAPANSAEAASDRWGR
jgi:hypothetical protein